jgi:hypothetical protein
MPALFRNEMHGQGFTRVEVKPFETGAIGGQAFPTCVDLELRKGRGLKPMGDMS